MSVIRQPGVLGRTTRRRVVGTTAALSAAICETVAVVLWFWLVVGSTATSTALAALGILFCGALLRAGLFEATVSSLGDFVHPRRLGAAVAWTTSWVVWLLVAEFVGGPVGVAVATAGLTILLVAQFTVERRVFRAGQVYDRQLVPSLTAVVPAVVLAAGAAALLVTTRTRFADWMLVSPPVSLEVTTIVIRIEAVHVGIAVFAICAFLAHQQRFRRLLSSDRCSF
ncbi:hypothetical protein [Halobiforma nitratireducens]|uniref:Uncharacterized protein n=1 Tax=Halobiforma nitratireducens JCM 10879 TaxID=1227454 RepID=M0L4N6_9EURY|nr:hypothetical protein [Halobiforma nitratireducens]EMA28058.1 hypothetical protein C446_17594 [Halobiforma nitratireducens JCM 10879]